MSMISTLFVRRYYWRHYCFYLGDAQAARHGLFLEELIVHRHPVKRRSADAGVLPPNAYENIEFRRLLNYESTCSWCSACTTDYSLVMHGNNKCLIHSHRFKNTFCHLKIYNSDGGISSVKIPETHTVSQII